MDYKISQSTLDAIEKIDNPPKTPFTHEGLLERGFLYDETYGTYEKQISHRITAMTRIDDNDGVIFGDGGATGFDTTITTLNDLDIFLSYIKHD